MTTHAERARRMYGAAQAAATAAPRSTTPAPTSPQTMSRGEAAKKLYESRVGVGTIGLALTSTFGRLRAGVSDAGRLAEIDEQRRAVGRLLDERQVEPSVAQKLLSIYVDHKLYTRSTGALDKRWSGPAGYAEVRREAGSDEAARAMLERTENVLRAVADASPSFARELIHSGAAQHPDFIKIASKLAEPKPAEPSTVIVTTRSDNS